ncbi:MAG: ATP-binding protein [Chitinophagaceae bacterium]|nr:ATP-binding protein [Chitinophagaceae bacterium]
MITRTAEAELRLLATQFKAVAVTGPRQSGKTTLVRYVFPEKSYVNLENPDIRLFAQEDPRGFLSAYPQGAVLDEIQRVPQLFSYLQEILDNGTSNGLFILTGSNNFLLQENISQSLAGRVAYLNLLPLSVEEIGNRITDNNELMLKGGYPAIYQEQIQAAKWFANYIRTYIERDVRLIKNIGNLYLFEKFLKLCAGRTGQLLNMSSLAIETGVDVKTIDSWLSVLETSFVIFRLQPYYQNFNKRVVKMPKLYFYDTGLALALLGVEDITQIQLHPFRGAIFENLVILEVLKQRLNTGRQPNLYFWRDNTGNEIDLLMADKDGLIPIEIKSGQTITADYLKGILYWNKISDTLGGYIIYGGNTIQNRSNGIFIMPLVKLHTLNF